MHTLIHSYQSDKRIRHINKSLQASNNSLGDFHDMPVDVGVMLVTVMRCTNGRQRRKLS